ncbi:MAG: hypothetical protein ACYC05_08985 [Sulfuricella sp.]
MKIRPEPGIWPGSVPILAQLVNGMRRMQLAQAAASRTGAA